MFINNQSGMLLGQNAPKDRRNRNAEIIQRPAALHIPINAPSQIGTTMPKSSHELTAIQSAYVKALKRTKEVSTKHNGTASWIGKQFTS